MPKKTKKEKIIAEYRRKLQSVGSKAVVNTKQDNQPLRANLPQETVSAPIYQLKQIPGASHSSPTVTSTLEISDIAAIRHDLTKTLMLAAITIAAELLLYWRIGR